MKGERKTLFGRITETEIKRKKQKYNWIAWLGWKFASVMSGFGLFSLLSVLSYNSNPILSLLLGFCVTTILSEAFPLKDFKIKQMKKCQI